MKETAQSDPQWLRISRYSRRCRVLGPGARFVIWVQGCPFRCRECVAPETLPFDGGSLVDVNELTEIIVASKEIEGVTFSGGEPMEQAAALHRLTKLLRTQCPDLGYLAYTGYLREKLEQLNDTSKNALLSQLDILIDGPYLPEEHAQLLWRGSRNQRIHFLTDRYQETWAGRTNQEGNQLEFEMDPTDGSVSWMGIPPRGFRSRFETEMKQRGVVLSSRTE